MVWTEKVKKTTTDVIENMKKNETKVHPNETEDTEPAEINKLITVENWTKSQVIEYSEAFLNGERHWRHLVRS